MMAGTYFPNGYTYIVGKYAELCADWYTPLIAIERVRIKEKKSDLFVLSKPSFLFFYAGT